MAESAGRIGEKCKVCGLVASRYRCPRCKLVSCSLACVKKHKEDKECDGIRDKTAFVEKSDFNDLILLSDYRFMEDMGRGVINAERTAAKQRIYRNHLPYWTNRLLGACKMRRINLKIMPLNFSKRKENSSVYMHKIKRILWHVQWQFPEAKVSFTDKKVPENMLVSEMLIKYISSDDTSEDMASLSIYKSGLDDIAVLMKLDNSPANAKSFFRFDLSKSLCDNLQQQTVIEFPTLFVILKKNIDKYLLKTLDEIQNTFERSGRSGHFPRKPNWYHHDYGHNLSHHEPFSSQGEQKLNQIKEEATIVSGSIVDYPISDLSDVE